MRPAPAAGAGERGRDMAYNNGYNDYGYRSEEYLDVNGFLAKTYRWMFLGLLATFGVALAGYMTGAVWFLFQNTWLLIVLSIAELGLVFFFSARLGDISPSTALRVFLAYSVLTGVTFSAYFLLFEMSSMVFAFGAAALYFGIMAWYGKNTERDLSGWGPMLRSGLLAMIVVSLVGMLLGGFGAFELIYCGVGLVVFMGLTAYDMQKIQHLYYQCGGGEMGEKIAVYGALELYLDFINIFLLILRMMGRSRD